MLKRSKYELLLTEVSRKVSRKDIKNISQNNLNKLTKFLVPNYWWYKSLQNFPTTYENTPNDFSFWKWGIQKTNKQTNKQNISLSQCKEISQKQEINFIKE